MPSPVGHALGGIAAGWLLSRGQSDRMTDPLGRRATLGFAALGIAADLDLAFDAHRGPSHSLGAAILVGLAAWGLFARSAGRVRWAIACAAAYGSHLLLDWLGSDTSAPFGIPALWPVSSVFYQAPWHLFLPVSRRIHQPDLFWIPNLLAVAREVVILLPIVALIGYACHKGRRRSLRNRAVAAAIAMLGAGWASANVRAGEVAPPIGEASALAQSRRPLAEVQDPPQGGAYVQAVVRYLRGDFEAATTAVIALTESDIRSQERALKNDAAMLQAAAMLHTEAARKSAGDSRVARLHLTRAHQLIVELRRLQPPGEFQRGWYLFVSAMFQGQKALNDADDILNEARGLFPRDPDLLLATGAAFELRTFIAVADPTVQQPFPARTRTFDPDADLQRALEQARRYLSEAAALAPESDEARLRLGRVLHRLGRVDQAVDEFDVVRRRASDDSLKYLSTLFEASAEIARHRSARASELYLEALGIRPTQSALVGLSHSYYEQGRGEESARVLQRVFRLGVEDHDPWFAYLLGDAWHEDARLKSMRATVTRPAVLPR
jgi:inner membrane protein